MCNTLSPHYPEDRIARLEAKLEEIHSELRGLRALMERAATSDPVVTLEEAAAQLLVAPSTLRRGLAGTHSIPRHSDRPVTFLQSRLDQFKRENTRRRAEAKNVRTRISLVRRRKRSTGDDGSRPPAAGRERGR